MFLYRKENALSSKLCKDFIDTFELSSEKYPGVLYGPDGVSSDSSKKSTDITFNPGYLKHENWGSLLQDLIPILEDGKYDYIDRHSIALSKVDPFELSSFFNLQRYQPGEGFFDWHCERASLKYSNRVLVWMIYLNTVTDKGETEFYYQQHLEPVVEGKLIIWPSDWMYLHKGIPSPTQTKYILTGWFTFSENK